MLSRMRILLSILGIVAVMSGCARRDAAGGAGTQKRVGVTLLTREHDFYHELERGLRDEAAKQHLQLLVTSGDFDLAKQQSQVENFVVQGVDAIIVCPVDTKGIGPAIEKANDAKIPVFTADIAAQGGTVVTHVASDNIEGGRLAAGYIARALRGKGKVGLIGQPEVQSTIDREAGFKEELAKTPGLVLVSTLNGAGVRDRALKAADDMLQAHPDLDAIFAINDESALGTLAAAQSRGARKLIIVGYDAGPEAVRMITGNTALKADVAQQPYDLGVRTIDAIADNFAGRQVPARITVPVRIVDRDSVKRGA
jgi:ribose transport system substrate-binding protein